MSVDLWSMIVKMPWALLEIYQSANLRSSETIGMIRVCDYNCCVMLPSYRRNRRSDLCDCVLVGRSCKSSNISLRYLYTGNLAEIQ